MPSSSSDFNAMADACRSRVYRAACLMLDDAHEAEDVTQEVFLEAWRGWARLEGRADAFTWLFTILRRVCARHRRRRWWLLFRTAARVSEEEADRLPDGDPPPDESQLLREQHAAVRELLRYLSLRLREVLVLRYVEECSVRQIAETLRIPEGTVKSRINYALAVAAARWRKEQTHEQAN